MKKILQQKLFIIGAVLLVVGIAVGVVNSVTHPKIKVVDTYLESIQKKNSKLLLKSLSPTARKEIKGLGINTDGLLMLLDFGLSLEDTEILQGRVVRDDEGKATEVKIIAITEKKGSKDVEVTASDIDLEEENGKIYIDGSLF